MIVFGQLDFAESTGVEVLVSTQYCWKAQKSILIYLRNVCMILRQAWMNYFR